MLTGQAQGHLTKHCKTKQEALKYLESTDLTKEQKRQAYDHWVSIQRHFRR